MSNTRLKKKKEKKKTKKKHYFPASLLRPNVSESERVSRGTAARFINYLKLGDIGPLALNLTFLIGHNKERTSNVSEVKPGCGL